MSIAVVAHRGKTFGGGLDELRTALAAAGYPDPLWFDVTKSSKAHKAVRVALKKGVELLLIWGGDGMVQHCIDAVGDHDVAVAILPAGTGNLLATDLGIPKDVTAAVDIALHGERKRLDVGVINSERFAVMAGTGFDAIMIADTGKVEKEVLGRLAYFRSGIQAMRARPVRMNVRLDGVTWFKGKSSCVLVGNIGRATGGAQIFEDASPYDGVLNIGVVTAKTILDWARVFLHVATDRPDASALLRRASGRRITVKLRKKRPYEVDGSVRPATKKLRIRVKARAVTVCIPRSSTQTLRGPQNAWDVGNEKTTPLRLSGESFSA